MFVVEALAVGLIFFLSMAIHEYAHGWVADRLGDATARRAGRLTLNPLKHVDPFGTIILPLFFVILILLRQVNFIVGFAKPVPVNPFNLRHPRRDMMWIGLAGPAVNLVLAVIFSKLILLPFCSAAVAEWLLVVVFINLLFAVFNMIPVPPLDGSRLVTALLPAKYAARYAGLEKYSFLMIILIFIALRQLDLFHVAILPAVERCGNWLGVTFQGILF